VIDWKATIEEHGPRIWHIGYKILGNEADTADCFQEVFASASQAAKKQDIVNMPGFLSVIATRQAIDLLRKRSRRNVIASGVVDCEGIPGRELTPLKNAENVELSSQLRAGLSTLADIEAQVFCLRALNEFSYRQIAAELDIDENYVGVLVHRAKIKLQIFLESVAVKDRREVANE
jgi:RNA polymerase sigma-70 factor (ECF subfamily)